MTLTSIMQTTFDLALVVLGFTLIIVIHELGHFWAARWAGIRVLAFAVGFGPAIASFRKGFGWRRGSSEREYHALLARDAQAKRDLPEGSPALIAAAVSPTEYRINALPFGGYVKMLGQDDADPSAISTEPDSFQRAPVWKRMIVISAGVVANLISAVILFVIVFQIGLKAEAPLIGFVRPGTPAAKAIATNAKELGVTKAGLLPGDRPVTISGKTIESFNDIAMASAMAGRGNSLRYVVERPGVPGVLNFDITPEVDPVVKFLSIGVGPMPSTTIGSGVPDRARVVFDTQIADLGFPQLHAGYSLKRVNGKEVNSYSEYAAALDHSGGEPVQTTFVDPALGEITIALTPVPELQSVEATVEPNKTTDISHVLGLTSVIEARRVTKDGAAGAAGMKAGDCLVQVGGAEWPSVAAAIAEIRASAGKSVRVVVARSDASGAFTEVDLGQVPVSRSGTLGFEYARQSSPESDDILARWPGTLVAAEDSPSGAQLKSIAGMRLVSLNDRPLSGLGELRDQLRAVAAQHPGESITVNLELAPALARPQQPGVPADSSRTTRIQWTIAATELSQLTALGYASPLPEALFGTQSITLKAPGILPAITRGLRETRNVMSSVYLTFAGLFDGSVKVEHLKGPVGIAHVGVIIADKGLIWMLFFMALISVNLAVLNFLPLPIVDGGHMVYLLYEQITGRPPPARFQNAAALAGLVLIGSLFLVVTAYNIRDVFLDIFR